MRAGMAEFKIPSEVDILDGALYCLKVKPHFAKKGGYLQFTWQGNVMAVVYLDRYIDINFNEMLMTSVEAALMQTDLFD
jgi:hypothetical protein